MGAKWTRSVGKVSEGGLDRGVGREQLAIQARRIAGAIRLKRSLAEQGQVGGVGRNRRQAALQVAAAAPQVGALQECEHRVRAGNLGVRDGRVAAVISQCPMMDGFAAMLNVARYAGVGYLFRIIWEGLCDVATIVTGRDPSMVPIVGPPGSIAAMTSPDAEPGFNAIAPPDFRNEICARIGLTMGFYRPGRKTARLRCPLLVCICEKDSVAPADAAEAAARRAGDRAEVKRYPIGHFEIYVAAFDTVVADHLAFLRKYLESKSIGVR